MNTNLSERVSADNDADTHQYERAKQSSIFHGLPKLKKRNQKADLEITNRDVEVIEFLIEMKFASANEVFEKFFRVTRNGEKACSTEWTKKRLKQLEEQKFVKSVYSFSDKTRFYVATLKGYYALAALCPEKEICRPAQGFDVRTFAHDKRVLDARMFLEQTEGVSCWLSERKLKSTPQLRQGLTSQYIPDAIYKTKEGEPPHPLGCRRLRIKLPINLTEIRILLVLQNFNKFFFKQGMCWFLDQARFCKCGAMLLKRYNSEFLYGKMVK